MKGISGELTSLGGLDTGSQQLKLRVAVGTVDLQLLFAALSACEFIQQYTCREHKPANCSSDTSYVACHAGSFTAADIQQVKTLFRDSLHAVEKDGTIRVHTLDPKL